MWRCRWLLIALCTPATAAADPPPPTGLVELPVRGFGAAVVVEATPERRDAPVLIAVHGNFDHPEWQCRVWARVVAGRAFVLCPRGIPRRDAPRFTYRNSVALAREIEAGLLALEARYAGRVTTSPVIYAGFSLGAILGADYLRRGRPVSLAILLEDAEDRWSPTLLRAFVARGGRGVLFGCGTPGCVRIARRITARLRSSGVAAGVVDGRPAGHTYWGPMLTALRGAFPHLADADPRLR